MNRRIAVVILGIMACAIPTDRTLCQEIPVTTQGNLKVVVLQGSPYERGRQHGKALRKEIHKLVRLWKKDIRKTYRIDADVFIKRFLAGTNYQEAVKEWTPQLWEELEGISEGSGLDLDTVFAFQLMDEIWVLGGDIVAEKCTTIGLQETYSHPAVVAQNYDMPEFYQGFQTLLHVIDPARDMETYLFTFPGFIASNGLNSHSVGVVVNAVQQLESSRDGLPVAFVIRGILQRKTYADAVRFLESIKFGAPQNYMIGGAGEMSSFECSATDISPFIPFENATFTYHTNHPLRNLNYSPEFLEYLEARAVSPKDYQHHCPRFQALQGIFPDNATIVDVAKLKDIFSNRKAIINNRGTFSCTIMVLGERPELHISPGRPDKEPFQVFRFNEE